MADTSRLEQFRKMANDDPTNELAHLSLGKAYLDAGQAEAAVGSLDRTIELNPRISKAYQIAAAALEKLGRKADAIDYLTRGVTIADERGERQTRDEMAATLKELGPPSRPSRKRPPRPWRSARGRCSVNAAAKPSQDCPSRRFPIRRAGRFSRKSCADCWHQWIRMGTKVINELRLPLNDPQAQKLYDQHMVEFLNLK